MGHGQRNRFSQVRKQWLASLFVCTDHDTVLSFSKRELVEKDGVNLSAVGFLSGLAWHLLLAHITPRPEWSDLSPVGKSFFLRLAFPVSSTFIEEGFLKPSRSVVLGVFFSLSKGVSKATRLLWA